MGETARDLFTFGHFPIVVGIIAFVVVVERMVADPTESLPINDRRLLIASMVLLIGGCLHIQWRVIRRLAPERFVAIALIAAWLLAGSALAGSAAVAGIAVTLAVMQAITWRRYRGGRLAEAVGTG